MEYNETGVAERAFLQQHNVNTFPVYPPMGGEKRGWTGMRKKAMTMAVAAILCVALTGCPGGSAFRGTKTSDADSFQMDYRVLNQREETSLSLAEPETDRQKLPDQSAAYEAYQFVLQQIAFEHVYPDGTDTGFDGACGFIEDNHFALLDVNRDGADELIVRFVTAPMAGNIELVYAYNQGENRVERVLAVFPAVTYYDNGLVKEEWSHGSALAGEGYWPYNLYRYQPDTGAYDLLAQVDMWSREAAGADHQGRPYPEDVDGEKAGTVFLLTRNAVTETVSRQDYETWLSGMMEKAQPVSVPYVSLNEENIRAVSPG